MHLKNSANPTHLQLRLDYTSLLKTLQAGVIFFRKMGACKIRCKYLKRVKSIQRGCCVKTFIGIKRNDDEIRLWKTRNYRTGASARCKCLPAGIKVIFFFLKVYQLHQGINLFQSFMLHGQVVNQPDKLVQWEILKQSFYVPGAYQAIL